MSIGIFVGHAKPPEPWFWPSGPEPDLRFVLPDTLSPSPPGASVTVPLVAPVPGSTGEYL